VAGPVDDSQSYVYRVARGFNRVLNALTGGDDQETISHRVARAREHGYWWGRGMCWALDKVKYVVPSWEDHCGKVLHAPSPTDATIPLDAPLTGDANKETPP
jgi:hypothetical protein